MLKKLNHRQELQKDHTEIAYLRHGSIFYIQNIFKKFKNHHALNSHSINTEFTLIHITMLNQCVTNVGLQYISLVPIILQLQDLKDSMMS